MLVLWLVACTSLTGTVRRPPPDVDPGTTDTEDTEDTGLLDDGVDAIGIDVSHWDGDVDWDVVAAGGYAFAYVKATQGVTFVDPLFDDNQTAMESAGVVRGAYHFGVPSLSDGATQARWFVDHGGGWPDDGLTLPGALDLEWNPTASGDDCYDLTRAQMGAWIRDFVDEYHALTGRYPSIYCGQLWWSTCVDDADYSDAALWVASWDDPAPYLPAGWTDYTLWQTGIGPVEGVPVTDVDLDVFHGSRLTLQRFVDGD